MPEAQFPRRTLLGSSLIKLVLCNIPAYTELVCYTGQKRGRVRLADQVFPGPSSKKIIVSHPPPLFFATPKV
jgi:hypothetical protein